MGSIYFVKNPKILRKQISNILDNKYNVLKISV